MGDNQGKFFFSTIVRNKKSGDSYSEECKKKKAKPRTHLSFAS